MQKRRLGRSPLDIAPLVLGGNVFGWTADAETSYRVLDGFVAAGGNCVDTANTYSTWVPGHRGGESEIIVGQWLKRRGRRDDVIVATKVGMRMGDGSHGLAPDYIRRSCDESLRRLQTDYIDIYQAHSDDEHTPQEETLGAFADLVKAGKVRALGASNFTAARLASSLAISARLGLPRYESLQPHFNLYERGGFEADVQPMCVEERVGVIPYFGLARGFLTGKYRNHADLEGRPRGSGVAGMLNARGFAILGALDAVAARHKATPAQVALAWVMAQPAISGPIASVTTPTQLHDIVGALKLKLDSDAMAALDRASA